ncbi:FAD-binding oxidoreductase [Streptomyces aculeolatus]
MLSRRSLLRAGGGVTVAAGAATVSTRSAFGAADKWSTLRGILQGDVVLPSDSGYGQAKQLAIGQYDAVNPQAIAYCETPGDVRACVLFAQHHGIPARVRSGGHNLNGWSTGEGLVVDLSRIDHATVSGSTVHVGPGAQSIDALIALKPYNKQIVTGTCPTVCPGGFVSGGGIGFQTRKFGMASDRLVSARVVLADGRIVRTSATREPDLFWALRGGGGGNFGAVVDWEVRPLDQPQMVTYDLLWAWDHAPQALKAWHEWLLDAPRALGSCLVVMPPYSGAPLVRIYGAHHGSATELDGLLDDLAARIGAPPIQRTSAPTGFSEGMKVLYGCGDKTDAQCHRVGTSPEAALGRTAFQRQSYVLTSRGPTAAESDAILSAWSSHDALLHRFLIIQAGGGAATDPDRGDTAFVHRDANFLTGFQGGADTADLTGELDGWAAAGAAALAPLASGAYINFPGSVRVPDFGRANYAENHGRLLGLKKRYDPHGFFRHPGALGVS